MNRWLIALSLFAGCAALGHLDASAQPPAQKKDGKFARLTGTPAAAPSGFNDKPSAEQIAFFEKKIRPVLIDQCYKCHAADAEKIKGGLTLDTRDGVRKGGDGGAVIVPGSPDRSSLIKAVRYKDDSTKMPPKAKLSDEQIADLETWVKMGAPDPRDGGAKAAHREIDIEKGRTFWAFQKPKPASVPAVKNAAFVRSPIDAFIMADLEKKGLTPVGDADKRTLLRRIHLDLTGLPPTPDEVEAFVADASPIAFEKVVDSLLASPRFGERWGRHWLDLARYAESSGKTANFNYPHAWRYRDYVIDAFNADKPYDQFIKEQLAGDLMPSGDPKVKAERIIATGFLAIGPKALNERNGLQFELDTVDEQIDVTTQAFLGITAACARCHDHKFDPIPTKDYYALAGIFRSTETCYGTVRFVQSQRPSPVIDLPAKSVPSAIADKLTDKDREGMEKSIKDIQERMKNVTDPINNIFNAAQLAITRSKLDGYHADGTPKLQAMGVREKPAAGGFGGPKGGFGMAKFGPGRGGQPTIGDSPIFTRGEPDKPTAERVPRGALQVVSTTQPRIRAGSGRLELANWIASKDNPLTARVMANRVWLHLFGRGLVPTAENFGAAGQPPSHPELLDHLAITFAADGWSVKKLIRRIVLSHAYQLDSKYDAKNNEADPENALVWRMTPRRLDAESLRDSMLAVSGRLDATPPVGSVVARAGEGPTVGRPRLGDSVQAAINDPAEKHRSIYLPIVRDNLVEALALFDAPDPSLIVADRQTTTVPSQGLFLLNNPFVIRSADAAAEKLLKGTTTSTERVRSAYLMFFGRSPSENELKAAGDFVKAYSGQLAKERLSAPPAARLPQTRNPLQGADPRQTRETWAAFCQALFASAEFQYRK
ncbi:MAG TPA: PSD1 and planctomycete cytochrome C domain-containing protein [Gemmataceae bacterium]|nr:PSD1 and planctomycete cytochrome C domain-containing protein [Gemmataceae bacterium]